MKTYFDSTQIELGLWLRIMYPTGELTPESARAVLRLVIPRSDKRLMHQLSEKARAGPLTEEEEAQMDAFERAGAQLSILKSRAREVLRQLDRVPK